MVYPPMALKFYEKLGNNKQVCQIFLVHFFKVFENISLTRNFKKKFMFKVKNCFKTGFPLFFQKFFHVFQNFSRFLKYTFLGLFLVKSYV